MGYEITVFVGTLHTNQPSMDDPNRFWFQVAAVVETSKAGGYLPDAITKMAKRGGAVLGTPAYLYPPAGDGDTEVYKDRYGDQLLAVSLDVVLNLLTTETMDGSKRLPWLRALLEVAPEPWATHVVLYGH